MPNSHPSARRGADDLRHQRHVCALVDGAADAEATLVPLVLDGVALHERAVHLVDGRHRDQHIESLHNAGLDTDSALDDGSLRVYAWDESYLRDGRFDPARMTAYIRETLAEGRALGFSRTRLIGFMEWALEDAPGVNGILDYEARLQVALRLLPDLVICVYDIRRHPQSILLETTMAHPSALIGGVLRSGGGERAAPRERILGAASELFTRQGVGATGVDSLIETAGVAKATFYRHFPSKDDLIIAWLRDPRTRWLDRLRLEAEERAGSPEEVIPAFFDAVTEWLAGDGSRGCPYLDTALAMPDLAPRARDVIVAYLTEVHDYLRDRLIAAGRADGERLADELQAVLAGGMTLSASFGNTGPARAARSAAVRLLAAKD
jgi:AcrR family transcriptional regulator